MARFGQGVMPQLGATDYTPFMQGAIRGSESVARGIEALGAGVAQGIDRYQQNKEMNKQAEAVIKSADKQAATLKKILPMLGGELEAQIGPSLDALLTSMSDTSLSVRQRAQIAQQGLKDFGETLNLGISAKQMQEKEREKQDLGILMSAVSTGNMDPVRAHYAATGRQLSPGAAKAFFELQNVQAQTADLRAQAAGRNAVRGQFFTPAQLAAFREQNKGLDFEAMPAPGGVIISKISPFAPPSTTNILTGDSVVPAKDIYAAAQKQFEIARPALIALDGFAEAEKILAKDTAITGIGAEPRLAAAKIGSLFGIGSEAVADTEILRAQIARPVLGLIKNLGSGTAISNTDRDFVEKIVGGSISLDGESISRLIRIGRQASEEIIGDYESYVDAVYPKDKPEFAQARASLMLPKRPGRGGAAQAPEALKNAAPLNSIKLPAGWSIKQ